MPRKPIKLNLDIIESDILQYFEVKQFDSVDITAHILSEGMPYTVDNCTFKLYVASGEDVTRQEKDITASGNKVSIKLDTNILALGGNALGELEITDSEGTISTATFRFAIVSKIGEGSNIPGNIDSFVVKYEKLIAESKKQVAGIVEGLGEDYQGLKRIIIEENQAADLQDQVNKTNAQLEHNVNELYETSKLIKAPYFSDECIITFIDDDAKSTFLTNVKSAYDETGVRPSIAIIPKNVGGSGFMTLNELKQLQSEGYEIVGHSYSHDESLFKNTSSSISSTLIDEDFRKCYDYLKENGFNSETLVYPWGYFEQTGQKERYCAIARKYFNNGVNAGYIGSQYNNIPNDNIYLNRYFINLSTINMESIKGVINGAINNKGWLIIGLHGGETSQINSTQLKEIINYIKGANIKILPFSEALKVKGNLISAGEFTDNSKGFFIGNNGALKGNLYTYDIKNYEVKATVTTSLTDFALASNLENNVSRIGKHINGTISLNNANMAGNVSQGTVIAKFEQDMSPSLPKWIKAFCITSTGTFEDLYCTIEWASDGTIIKAQQTKANNNIRWIICEFAYISKI